jgi:rubrerythrin
MTDKDKLAKRLEELSKIFSLAIRSEQASQKMYAKAMSCCDDAEWRGLLAALRADEVRHEKELKSLFAELTNFLALQAAAKSGARKKTAAKTASRSRFRAAR